MNLFAGLLITIFAWAVFATLVEIKSAGGNTDGSQSSNGCCGDGMCGKNLRDNTFYWTTLIVSIFFTLAVLGPSSET